MTAMKATLSQLSMHHAELALRIHKGDGQVKGLTTGVGSWLAGAIGVAAGAGMYAVSVFTATLSFAILHGLRKRSQQRLSDGHQRTEFGEKVPKEFKS